MTRTHPFAINRSTAAAVAALLALVAVTPAARAVTTFYETEAAWQAAVTTAGYSIEDLDLLNPAAVAQATEVGAAPSGGANLGTSVLTFETSATGLAAKVVIEMTESASIIFQTSGARPGLEPSGSGQEDFEHSYPDGTTIAFGLKLWEHQAGSIGPASSWECFDSLSNSLGSLVVSATDPDQGTNPFIGVVSDSAIARCVFTHNSGENLSIQKHRFAFSAVGGAFIGDCTDLTALAQAIRDTDVGFFLSASHRFQLARFADVAGTMCGYAANNPVFYNYVIVYLNNILIRVDGDPAVPDWMIPSAETDAIVAQTQELISGYTGLLP